MTACSTPECQNAAISVWNGRCSPCNETYLIQRAAAAAAWDRHRDDLPERLAHALARAGVTPDDVAAMTDAELLALRDVGRVGVRSLRAVAPYTPTAYAGNWVGESVPEMAGGA